MPTIKLDVAIRLTGDLRHDAEQIKRMPSELGFDGVWVSETAHNPFFPLSIAAKETKGIRIGTLGRSRISAQPNDHRPNRLGPGEAIQRPIQS